MELKSQQKPIGDTTPIKSKILKKRKSRAKIFGGILLVLIVIIAILSLTTIYLSKKPATTDSDKTSEENSQSSDCQSNPNPKFTTAFTDLEKIDAIAPLGTVGGGSPGRSYITVKEGMEAPVYNPTDAVLETIIYARRGGPETPGEYGLYFRASCEVIYLLDHIDRVTEKIRALAPEDPSGTTGDGPHPNIEIKAGELLGYSDGTPQARTFDFIVLNQAKEVFHINPERWEWEQAKYADCPYDYYERDLKDSFYDLLGTIYINEFLPAEGCGSASQDIAGTISGGWFQGTSSTSQGTWLGIVQQFSWVEVAIREDLNKTFDLKDFSPSLFPKEVTVGKEVCYHGYQGNYAFLKLDSENRLLVVTGEGDCPSVFPSSGVTTWER